MVNFLNITVRQILSRWIKPLEPKSEDFCLPELSPWRGRRAIVYRILDDCWEKGITSYKGIKLEVKNRTGVSCSSAMIAAWKNERKTRESLSNQSAASPQDRQRKTEETL